jgi:hypothetical protein
MHYMFDVCVNTNILKLQLSGKNQSVVSLKQTNVSEVCTTSNFKATEAARTSETSVYFNYSTRSYIPQDGSPPWEHETTVHCTLFKN